MHWRNVVGVIVAMTALACGPEATRTPATTPAAPAPTPAPTPAAPAGTPATTPAAPETPPAVADADRPEAATPGADAKPKDDPAVAKSGAPVTIKAAFPRSGAADLDVVFGADGTDVTVKVWGTDGLKVSKSSAAAPLPTVRKAQKLAVAVEYTAPADRDSNLAISVTGKFAGREQSRTQSFTVKASAPAPKDPAAAPKVDKDGRKIKVMTPK
jgi:hypothetical protein